MHRYNFVNGSAHEHSLPSISKNYTLIYLVTQIKVLSPLPLSLSLSLSGENPFQQTSSVLILFQTAVSINTLKVLVSGVSVKGGFFFFFLQDMDRPSSLLKVYFYMIYLTLSKFISGIIIFIRVAEVIFVTMII